MFPFLQRQHLNRVGSNEPTPCRRQLTHIDFYFLGLSGIVDALRNSSCEY